VNIEDLNQFERELEKVNKQRTKYSDEYRYHRQTFGECLFQINIAYAKRIKEFMAVKKNLGYDTGLLLLLADAQENEDEEFIALYKLFTESRENYRGIEKLLDALEGRSISIMALLKRHTEEEIYSKGE